MSAKIDKMKRKQMTDQERLEEIKNVRWENLKTSQILHVKWLIERAQELENLNGLSNTQKNKPNK